VMTDEEMLFVMAEFRKGYGMGDKERLLAVTTQDFEWHQHNGGEGPTGRVIKGIGGLLEELTWRQAHWRDVTYENLTERAAGDVILQMFTTRGVDENDISYHVNVVDVYPVREGLICRKDTYWKNIT
jgi:ketosteroid isomerase-like protein